MFFKSDTFALRFMLETCVHFDFWNNSFFQIFQRDPPMIWGYYSIISIYLRNEKYPKSYSKTLLLIKSKCAHVTSINLKAKVWLEQHTALIYFCSYPCGTLYFFYIELIISWLLSQSTVPSGVMYKHFKYICSHEHIFVRLGV